MSDCQRNPVNLKISRTGNIVAPLIELIVGFQTETQFKGYHSELDKPLYKWSITLEITHIVSLYVKYRSLACMVVIRDGHSFFRTKFLRMSKNVIIKRMVFRKNERWRTRDKMFTERPNFWKKLKNTIVFYRTNNLLIN